VRCQSAAVRSASAGASSAQMKPSTGDGSGPIDPQHTIDELRQRNAELVKANERLAEAIAARDSILAIAAHELRNPMTPLLGRVQLLRRMASKSDFQREMAEEGLVEIEWLIGQYVKRATTLLDVSRITSGRLQLDRAPVDICEMVREVEESFRPIAAHAGSDLATDLPAEALVVTGDRLAVEEILDNLVSNAIKYGNGKPVAITAAADAEKGVALIRVQDGGAGISPSDQARIFERFERAVRPGEHHGGFGVGLWIVRRLSEAMGGTIEVRSIAGAGSTFSVTLPLQSSKEQE
jgi:two-component system, OmpR family, sensor kinase